MNENTPRRVLICTALSISFGLFVFFACAQTAQAQWTTTGNGDAANNHSSGKVGIGRYATALDIAKPAQTNHSSGKVGVGRDIPSPNLDVESDLQVNNIYLIDTGGLFSSSNLESGMVVRTAGNLDFRNGGFTKMSIDTSGKVGIGTESPAATLDVFGSVNLRDGYDLTWGGTFVAGAPTIAGTSSGGGHINFYPGGTTSGAVATLSSSGLNVSGNIASSGTIEGGTIKAKYQDVAEWVPSSEKLFAGTVVVLDSTKSNQVISSSTAYDTRVAGVISAQPGIALGEKGEGKVLVATTGRVKIKVDATKTPIHIGDLLVTSDVLGVAMKSEPIEMAGRKMHMPGTLIGKALEPLEKGKGEILVLLSLQ